MLFEFLKENIIQEKHKNDCEKMDPVYYSNHKYFSLQNKQSNKKENIK
jgi:hypothetical protein